MPADRPDRRSGAAVSLEVVDPLALPGLEPRGALLARLADAPHPLLLAGDCNEWSRQRGFEPLTADFSVHMPGPSFHAARPRLPLDRFATRGALAVSALEVVADGEGARAADHLPIRMVVRAG